MRACAKYLPRSDCRVYTRDSLCMLIDLKRRTRTRVSLRRNIAREQRQTIQRHSILPAHRPNQLELRGDADEFTKGFRTIRDDKSRVASNNRQVSPSSLAHRRRSIVCSAPLMLRNAIRNVPFTRPHTTTPEPPLFPHPIKSIVLTSKAAGVAEAIHHEEFAAMRARSLRGRKHRQDPLHIWIRRVGGHDAPFIYGCLCTYVSRAIAQRSLARTGVSVCTHSPAHGCDFNSS